ncbi:hypothetical protein Cob_v003032 [Colletotrichum orbiculare MAFF 240422]|uniref:Uncharacterized protein n=1 Tax=Colletotrichum orbiculare (strain 104-T / ATCC 96160 / CBS 514.97 / LARS 414 / MAFF 240422) TaxID=1213857 RepID=A0A484G0R7_COLOR|nr:hypothetical protein Cob_v003032 [Colletotrichum orbiculare MAFF 240422]
MNFFLLGKGNNTIAQVAQPFSTDDELSGDGRAATSDESTVFADKGMFLIRRPAPAAEADNMQTCTSLFLIN